VIASEASKDAGAGGFAYLEFAIVGVPLLIGTAIITVLLASKLLPRRRPVSMPPDFSAHARALMRQYAIREPVFHLTVLPGSPIIGATRETVDLSPYEGVTLISAQEEARGFALQRLELAAGDVIAARGDDGTIARLAADFRLEKAVTEGLDEERLFTTESGVVEIVVPPRSEVIGGQVFPGMVASGGDLVVLSVQRSGEERPGKTTLAAGDTLLMRGTWEALEEQDRDPNLRVVDAPKLLQRELAPLSRPAWICLAVVAGMVVLLVTGVVPPAVSGALAAVAIVLFRVLTMQEAYRGISWSIVVLIAGMIPLSTAMTETGAASDIADEIVNAIGSDASPYILIIALFVLVAVVGQVLSNTATALIVFPIAIAAATELDVSVQPVLMCVVVAAHASFLTPIATTPNLMVFEAGGYRFADYWKFGLPLMVLYFAVAVLLVPAVWRF
jgi:di/tricarboxylate transporter